MVQNGPQKRIFLELCDKLRFPYHLDRKERSVANLCREFRISYRTAVCIKRDRSNLMALDRNRVPLGVKRSLHARIPDVDKKVEEFIRFAWSHRLPVTMHLIQERALIKADEIGIPNFVASVGWFQKFLPCSPVQPFYSMHGRGGNVLPAGTANWMEQIRMKAPKFHLFNIYNMDESGLLYRMGPRRSYLTGEECRSDKCATYFS